MQQMTMDFPIIYGCSLLVLTLALCVLQAFQSSLPWKYVFPRIITKHLTYPYCLNRHRFFGPWTRAGFISYAMYLGINLCFLIFPVSSLDTLSARAGQLSIYNLALLYISPPSLAAHLLGMKLSTFMDLHHSLSTMSLCLAVLHVVIKLALGSISFTLTESKSFWKVMALGFLLVCIVLSVRVFRRKAFEAFFQVHLVLAMGLLLSLFFHVPENRLALKLALSLASLICMAGMASQIIMLGYWSGFLGGKSRCYLRHPRHTNTGQFTMDNGRTLTLELTLPRPIAIAAGQYINLWLPTLSILSAFQTHPFTVSSWNRSQDIIEIYVKCQSGLTAQLLRRICAADEESRYIPASFTGPFGVSEPVDVYDSILLLITDDGIAAVLGYLAVLLESVTGCRIRRIHLVWQVQNLGTCIHPDNLYVPNSLIVSDTTYGAAQDMLNTFLNSDKRKGNYVLTISIHDQSGHPEAVIGTKQRVFVHTGLANYPKIIENEADICFRSAVWSSEKNSLLLIVSANNGVRDQIRSYISEVLYQRISFIETEFQST